jgi:hypothetical protein
VRFVVSGKAGKWCLNGERPSLDFIAGYPAVLIRQINRYAIPPLEK